MIVLADDTPSIYSQQVKANISPYMYTSDRKYSDDLKLSVRETVGGKTTNPDFVFVKQSALSLTLMLTLRL